MRVHFFQHVPFEGLGSIEAWARARQHDIGQTRTYANDPYPDPASIDMLFVMGGPMGVHDEGACPWLPAEKRAIEAMIRAEKMVIGICLGAQLIAEVLGARVYTNRYREIGWFPVSIPDNETRPALLAGLPERADAFHWHQDTFDIPTGATRVAHSEACENQAFCYGNTTLALQFHWEIAAAGVESLIANCSDDYALDKPWVQKPPEMLADKTRFQRSQRLMGIVLQNAAHIIGA